MRKSDKMKLLKIVVIFVLAIFMMTSVTVLLSGNSVASSAEVIPASGSSGTGNAHLLNALSDPVLPSGFPPANFSNPQISEPPAVPDTTPVVIPITAFGNVSIPNATWETAILNVTGYTAGTAYDYFNDLLIDGSTVWVGVNPEAGSWGVQVNISMFMSFFDGKNSISVSGHAGFSNNPIGLYKNFRGIQYNNYTLYLYPVPAGQSPPTYPSQVITLHTGINHVNIPVNTVAADVQSIAIDGEFKYTVEPSWAAYTWSVNGTKLADSFIYPWINSGGIDLFSWRSVYPPYMLNHQWNNLNLTGALGMIEGSNVPLQVSPASLSPGISEFWGNLFLYAQSNVLGAKQLSHYFKEGTLYNQTQTIAGLVNENGNNYSMYNSYRNIYYGASSLIKTTDGVIRVSTDTSMRYVNLQSMPNAVWQNISQNEVSVTHTLTAYNERGVHGTVSSTTVDVFPVSFDYGSIINYMYSSGDLSYYNYTSYFFNVLEAYNVTTYTNYNINGHHMASFSSTSDMIYGTNGEFSSILEEGPGFAIILNLTSTYHLTKKIFTSINTQFTGHGFITNVYTHKLAALGTDPNLYYVQQNIYLNQVTMKTYNHPYPGFGTISNQGLGLNHSHV